MLFPELGGIIMPSKERNTSLDLYRFLCMFLITTIHITGYCNLIGAVVPGQFNFYILHILYAFQRFAIAGFILISAYFLVESTDTAKKLITFWVQLIFFSIVIFGLTCLLIPSAFSWKHLIKSIFPVLTYHYWYPISYIILLIFAPLLNKFVRSITKTELLSAIFLLSFVISVFLPLNPFFDATAFLGHQSHSILWFVQLYLIAAYIRLYGVKRAVLFGPVCFLIVGVLLFLLFIGRRFAINASITVAIRFFDKIDLLSYNSLLPLLFSVSSFITFLHMKISLPKWLNRVIHFLVPTAFGIYLVQEHNALRQNLWNFFQLQRYADGPWLLPMIVLVFFAIWGAAIAVHLLYRLARKLFLIKLEQALMQLLQHLRKR